MNSREYQYGFSERTDDMYDKCVREKKAITMISVLKDHLGSKIKNAKLLNVGGSTGIIDNYLSKHTKEVISIDIDEPAIHHAQRTYQTDNLTFQVADALNLPFHNNSFDIVICSQVYEHVPDAEKMFEEIFRVLLPNGVCYFAAGNRIMWNEPHYNLPLLSILPNPLANFYMRITGKGQYYYEKHLTYWGLKKLVNKFKIIDYTKDLVCEPEKYSTSYMIETGSLKQRMAKFVISIFYWATPGYIWLLEKDSKLAMKQSLSK